MIVPFNRGKEENANFDMPIKRELPLSFRDRHLKKTHKGSRNFLWQKATSTLNTYHIRAKIKLISWLRLSHVALSQDQIHSRLFKEI